MITLLLYAVNGVRRLRTKLSQFEVVKSLSIFLFFLFLFWLEKDIFALYEGLGYVGKNVGQPKWNFCS